MQGSPGDPYIARRQLWSTNAGSPLEDTFRSDVLKRLAALEKKGEKEPSTTSEEYQKLWEAFSLLVKIENARDKDNQKSEKGEREAAAELIQNTFRNHRMRKRNDAARKIQKLYRQRYAKRNGAATTIQAAFRSYKQKKYLRYLRAQHRQSSAVSPDNPREEKMNDETEDEVAE